MAPGNGRPELFDVNVSLGPLPQRPPGAPVDAASLLKRCWMRTTFHARW